MISKITESNKELIKTRMQEINQAFHDLAYNEKLREIAVDISAPTETEKTTAMTWADENAKHISENLEGYYANIRDIAKLSTNFHNAPYKYFLMPLDEPIFEIDANKRTIAVPQHFAKNGIGVHGDHMAEVLYFRIDRYFDYQDLYNVDEIIINWQFRPASGSRNAETETHTSYALAPDETYDPGHIVFGWVIGNFVDDEGKEHFMTPSKGTLSFSISFLKRTGETYQYLLNTLISSVNINDSFVLEDPTKLDSLRHPVFERLSDSRYTADGVTPLVDPVYRTNPVEVQEDGHTVTEYKGLPVSKNFDIEDGIEAEQLLLQTIGYVPDDGNIKYTWHGTTISGTSVDREPDTLTSINDYVLTSDTVADEKIKYYTLVDGEMTQIPFEKNGTTMTFSDVMADPTLEIYELGSSLEVNEAGSYQVTMQSKKIVDGVSESINSGNVPSQTCVIPMAAVPSVELAVTARVTPESGNYTIYDEALASQYTFVSDGAPGVIATIGIDESKIWNSDEGTGIPGVTADSSIGAIALVMTSEEGDNGKPTAEDFAGMEFKVADGAYSINAAGGALPVDSASATGEGLYKVYAVNRRNHTYNVSDASDIITVSTIAPMLEQIVLKVQDNNEFVVLPNIVEDPDAQTQLNENYPIRYFQVSIGDTLNPEVELVVRAVEIDQSAYSADGSIVYSTKESDIPLEYAASHIEADQDNFYFQIEDDPGLFVIEVTTKYHGTQRVTITDPFKVTTTL